MASTADGGPGIEVARVRLQVVLDFVRAEVLKGWGERSCIVTSRVLLEVLDWLGTPGKPVPVAVMAFNEAGWQAASWDRPEQRLPVEQWPPQAWSVGVNGSGRSEASTNGWDGHLVVVVSYRGRDWLLDGSLDQLSRPQRGIELAPLVTEVPSGWAGQSLLHLSRGTGEAEGGLHLLYDRMVKPGAWRDANDWRGHKAEARAATAAVIASVRPLRDSWSTAAVVPEGDLPSK